MLRYTGHPVADVGVATIAAFCEKTDPGTLTQDDLFRVAQFMEKEYFSGKLLSYLTCVFPNSAYVQPSAQPGAKVKMKPATLTHFKHNVLYAFQKEPDPDLAPLRCVFSGQPASQVVYRQHVPMITGENVLNFFPAGLGGLPIAGPYLLAIQAFPLGARRCHGRALAVHSPDDDGLTYAFVKRFLEDNRKLMLLAERSGEKYADAKWPKTLVISVLLEIEEERHDQEANTASSVTVYHLTNSGQGPDIEIFHLPSEVVRFVRKASRASMVHIWRRIQETARAKSAGARKKRQSTKRTKQRSSGETQAPESLAAAGHEIPRNYLYEDLFALPANAAHFIRTYFLRRAYRFAREEDPRRTYNVLQELDLVSWAMTRLFLQEVVSMDKSRIEAIRTLGDRIAAHIVSENDRRLFQTLYRADRYLVLRNVLIKASGERLKKEKPPLVSFDEFLEVFEEGEEVVRVDWRLARDLLLIRVIEELHRQGWFGRQADLLDELASVETTGETEEAVGDR